MIEPEIKQHRLSRRGPVVEEPEAGKDMKNYWNNVQITTKHTQTYNMYMVESSNVHNL